MSKDFGAFILAGAILIAGLMLYTKEPVVVNVDGAQASFGASSGPDVTSRTTFQSGMAEGGEYVFTATSTQAAVTLTDRDMSNAKVITIAAVDAPALVMTLPASTTWSGLNKPGVAQEWIIDNRHTAAATTTTITAGAGVDIDGTTANDDVLNGGVSGVLKCWRLSTTFDIRCIVEEMVDAG